MQGVQQLYRDRFTPGERERKAGLWRILCAYLQRWIPEDGAVLDMGAGYCEFINTIKARRKVAVDLNPDTRECAAAGVEVRLSPCDAMGFLPDGDMDAVFICNMLEHLPGKEQVLSVLKEAARVTRAGGRLVLIQPNIRYAFDVYWDFFDHHVALTDRSLVEAVRLAGWAPVKVIPRFLPFSTKGGISRMVFLFRVYMAFPILWRIFGKQTLVVAEKRAS